MKKRYPPLRELSQGHLPNLKNDIDNRVNVNAIGAGVKGCVSKGVPASEQFRAIGALHRGASVDDLAAMVWGFSSPPIFKIRHMSYCICVISQMLAGRP
jgi:hypothetical protein